MEKENKDPSELQCSYTITVLYNCRVGVYIILCHIRETKRAFFGQKVKGNVQNLDLKLLLLNMNSDHLNTNSARWTGSRKGGNKAHPLSVSAI
jgi:hypothetical protein